MTTTRFTKEQLIAKAQEQIEFIRRTQVTGVGREHVDMCGALFEIALASLEAEPVAWIVHARTGDQLTTDGGYVANAEGILGLHSTPLYTAPPAPVSVPVALNRLRSIVADPRALPRRKEWISGQQYSYVLLENVEAMVDDACRAALLQGSQPVSNRDELPLDYLQGHKDGLEWAAQLAEANHPQTGDWLYDDPTELAKAIRKGPDMPPVEPGNSPVIPDGWVMVPIEPTEDMIINGFESEPDESFSDEKEWEAYEDMSGCQQAAHRAKLCWAAMIKAAPQ